MVGFSDPDANGAIVRGTSATAIERSKVQWYEPCDGFAGGTGAGSFARIQLVEFVVSKGGSAYQFLG